MYPLFRCFSEAILARYPNSSLLLATTYSILDSILLLLRRPSSARLKQVKTKSILVVNLAHIGDILYSQILVDVLKRAFPESSIGFLCGSWCHSVLELHNSIDAIYCLDHYRLNRRSISLFLKIIVYLRGILRIVKQLRDAKYNSVIVLNPKPNILPILCLCSIPTRIGYTSAGLGSLLTDPYSYPINNWHITQYHINLLRSLGVSDSSYSLQPLSTLYSRPDVVETLLTLYPQLSEGFFILHVGTGEVKREWPVPKWRELIRLINQRSKMLVFTGLGPREEHIVATLFDSRRKHLNLCGKLNWLELNSIISIADHVICVESVVSHLCAIHNVPASSVWSGLNRQHYFKPLNKSVVTLTADLDCLGCFRGCYDMSCLTLVEPVDVFQSLPLMS